MIRLREITLAIIFKLTEVKLVQTSNSFGTFPRVHNKYSCKYLYSLGRGVTKSAKINTQDAEKKTILILKSCGDSYVLLYNEK